LLQVETVGRLISGLDPSWLNQENIPLKNHVLLVIDMKSNVSPSKESILRKSVTHPKNIGLVLNFAIILLAIRS
jgi:hypothetical protein